VINGAAAGVHGRAYRRAGRRLSGHGGLTGCAVMDRPAAYGLCSSFGSSMPRAWRQQRQGRRG
jgi:hypothetical protein